MPNYDYECEKCGKTFEVFQSMKDKAFKTCPESSCLMEKWGQGKVRRLLGTGAGLIFKGSGFYITDYRSEGYKQAAKNDSATPAPKTESKPAAPATPAASSIHPQNMKICTACKTQNDDTRVFCLNCGQRLPSSEPGSPAFLPAVSAGASAPPLPGKDTTKKSTLQKLPKPRRSVLGLLWSLLLLGILAALGFSIYLVGQPPDEIAPPVSKDAVPSQTLAAFFKKASISTDGVWMGGEESINRFLSENVKLAPVASPLGLHTEFKRCYVELHDGRLDFVMEQSLERHPLYFTLVLEPYSDAGRLKVRYVGASLGRLPVPAPLVPLLIGLWKPCFDSLGAIMDTLESASAATVSPKNLVVRWSGNGKP
jgi:putative FmdB family regulatory protein